MGGIGLAKVDSSPGLFPRPAMNDDPMAITRQLLVCAGDASLKRQASCVQGTEHGPVWGRVAPAISPHLCSGARVLETTVSIF